MTESKLGTKVFLVLERRSPTWQGRLEIGRKVMARGTRIWLLIFHLYTGSQNRKQEVRPGS